MLKGFDDAPFELWRVRACRLEGGSGRARVACGDGVERVVLGIV